LFGNGVGGLSDFSSAHVGEDEARRRVHVMKTNFSIIEFIFYNAFKGYSEPPDSTTRSWTRPKPLSTTVDKATIDIYVNEIQAKQPIGRAWLAVNAMARDHCDHPECSPRLGSHKVEGIDYLDVVAPNAELAKQIAPKWAAYAKSLGVSGIFWSTMGKYGSCEGCDWPGFLHAALLILESNGLNQNAEFVDGYGWSSSFLTEANSPVSYPVWSFWKTTDEHKAKFLSLGANGAWSTTLKVDDGAHAVATIIDRTLEAACSNDTYLAIIDGERRIFTDYYPDAKLLTPDQVNQIQIAIQSVNPKCQTNTFYKQANAIGMGSASAGIDSVEFHFEADFESIDKEQFLKDFKQALIDGGADPAQVNAMELVIAPASTGTTGRRLSTGGVVVKMLGSPDAVSATVQSVTHGITVEGFPCSQEVAHGINVDTCAAATTSTVAATTATATVTTTVATTVVATTVATTVTTTSAVIVSTLASTNTSTTSSTTVQVTPYDTFVCNEVNVLSWTEEKQTWCCEREFKGCVDNPPWWKEVVLLSVVIALACLIAIFAACACKKSKQLRNFDEVETRLISQVPLTAPGDDPVDEELQTPLVLERSDVLRY
jgi:hypothetical protein